MNTSDAGDEPLGEAPELTMPRAVSQLDRQARALTEIRSLHYYRASAEALTDASWPECGWCEVSYPCPTISILDRLGI